MRKFWRRSRRYDAGVEPAFHEEKARDGTSDYIEKQRRLMEFISGEWRGFPYAIRLAEERGATLILIQPRIKDELLGGFNNEAQRQLRWQVDGME